MALSPSLGSHCTDTRAFYIAALSIFVLFLDFVSGNLVLTGFDP